MEFQWIKSDFNTITFQHEKTLLEARNTRITPSMYKAISDAMDHNNPVGSLIGYYDEKLSISFASQSFLYELGFDEEDFQSGTEDSLLRLIYSQDLYLFSPDKFLNHHGKNGIPNAYQRWQPSVHHSI